MHLKLEGALTAVGMALGQACTPRCSEDAVHGNSQALSDTGYNTCAQVHTPASMSDNSNVHVSRVAPACALRQ
jgi:hypothetical protein